MSEEFKFKPDLNAGDLLAEVARSEFIRLQCNDNEFALNVPEARALRDWLNEVLP